MEYLNYKKNMMCILIAITLYHGNTDAINNRLLRIPAQGLACLTSLLYSIFSIPLELITFYENNSDALEKASLGIIEVAAGGYLLTRRTTPHMLHIIGIGFVGDGTQRLYNLFVNQRFNNVIKVLETYKQHLTEVVKNLATTNTTVAKNGKNLVQLQQNLADLKKASKKQHDFIKKQIRLLATQQQVSQLKTVQKKQFSHMSHSMQQVKQNTETLRNQLNNVQKKIEKSTQLLLKRAEKSAESLQKITEKVEPLGELTQIVHRLNDAYKHTASQDEKLDLIIDQQKKLLTFQRYQALSLQKMISIGTWAQQLHNKKSRLKEITK